MTPQFLIPHLSPTSPRVSTSPPPLPLLGMRTRRRTSGVALGNRTSVAIHPSARPPWRRPSRRATRTPSRLPMSRLTRKAQVRITGSWLLHSLWGLRVVLCREEWWGEAKVNVLFFSFPFLWIFFIYSFQYLCIFLLYIFFRLCCGYCRIGILFLSTVCLSFSFYEMVHFI